MSSGQLLRPWFVQPLSSPEKHDLELSVHGGETLPNCLVSLMFSSHPAYENVLGCPLMHTQPLIEQESEDTTSETRLLFGFEQIPLRGIYKLPYQSTVCSLKVSFDEAFAQTRLPLSMHRLPRVNARGPVKARKQSTVLMRSTRR
jgi:hypothetical protein